MIKILHHPMRIYFRNRHVHHGLSGSILIVIGIVLVVTDWKDRWWSFTEDFDRYDGITVESLKNLGIVAQARIT